MVYSIEWAVSEDVLCVTFHADFTAANLNSMIRDLYDYTAAVNKPVHIVVDIASGYQFPTGINTLLPLAKHFYDLPNLSHTVLVTGNLRLWLIGKLLSQLCNRKQRVVTTSSVSAALDYLAHQDESRNVYAG